MEVSLVSAFRMWTPRQWFAAALATIASLVILGVPTVLIPNSLFSREIPPTAWSYPVWIVTSVLMGLLVATYVKSARGERDIEDGATGDSDKGSRLGVVGGAIAWFAIGCPVCNKIVLLLLGASGAMTWFAPVQPFLAAAALILTTIALAVRLRGQVSCPLPAPRSDESTPKKEGQRV